MKTKLALGNFRQNSVEVSMKNRRLDETSQNLEQFGDVSSNRFKIRKTHSKIPQYHEKNCNLLKGGDRCKKRVNLVDLSTSFKMLQNTPLVSLAAKIGIDTAENGPSKVCATN